MADNGDEEARLRLELLRGLVEGERRLNEARVAAERGTLQKPQDTRRARWSEAVVVAIIGVAGAVIGAAFQAAQNVGLESQRFKFGMIEKAFSESDSSQQRKYLQFLKWSRLGSQLDRGLDSLLAVSDGIPTLRSDLVIPPTWSDPRLTSAQGLEEIVAEADNRARAALKHCSAPTLVGILLEGAPTAFRVIYEPSEPEFSGGGGVAILGVGDGTSGRIDVFPSTFSDGNYYLFSERRWARDPVEAATYIILLELAAVEVHLSKTSRRKSPVPLMGRSDFANNFANYVLRCAER